ncbi:ArsR/SmtB family transcription factor [Xanthobacter sp. TB0139]|uniref:ArsR/SmtB family transcription factor n=1 Tax=Xanthobacter sp. TB0139 TaxID=3459178 RepID=UPI00403A164D
MNESSICSSANDTPVAECDLLAERLRALAHPVRLRVLVRLARQECCPCKDIVRDLPLAQSTVSQHLKVLVEAGLLYCAPEGQRMHYHIDREVVAALRQEMDALFGTLLAVPEQGEP